MKDFNNQETRPKIGIYDDNLRSFTVYQLGSDSITGESNDKVYGSFRQINKIE